MCMSFCRFRLSGDNFFFWVVGGAGCRVVVGSNLKRVVQGV